MYEECDFCGSEMDYDREVVGGVLRQSGPSHCMKCYAMLITEFELSERTWDQANSPEFQELLKEGKIEVKGVCYRYKA